MKKRLRKKKHVCEFKEFGFPVQFRFFGGLSTVERNALLDEWVLLIEANGLQFGGGGPQDVWEGFVALDKRGSTTEDHRRVVDSWLRNESRVSAYKVGLFVDAWYGDVEWLNEDRITSRWRADKALHTSTAQRRIARCR